MPVVKDGSPPEVDQVYFLNAKLSNKLTRILTGFCNPCFFYLC